MVSPSSKRQRGCTHLGALRERQGQLQHSLLRHCAARQASGVSPRSQPPCLGLAGLGYVLHALRGIFQVISHSCATPPLQEAGLPPLPLGDGWLCLGCGAAAASRSEHAFAAPKQSPGCTGEDPRQGGLPSLAPCIPVVLACGMAGACWRRIHPRPAPACDAHEHPAGCIHIGVLEQPPLPIPCTRQTAVARPFAACPRRARAAAGPALR